MINMKDGIIGHAIGDAMGVPVEFKDRESLMYNPVKEMRRSYAGDKGTWSDDTSMEIATMDSFINNKGWNYDDIMINFGDWINDSKFTAHNYTFDVGSPVDLPALMYSEDGFHFDVIKDNESGKPSTDDTSKAGR